MNRYHPELDHRRTRWPTNTQMRYHLIYERLLLYSLSIGIIFVWKNIVHLQSRGIAVRSDSITINFQQRAIRWLVSNQDGEGNPMHTTAPLWLKLSCERFLYTMYRVNQGSLAMQSVSDLDDESLVDESEKGSSLFFQYQNESGNGMARKMASWRYQWAKTIRDWTTNEHRLVSTMRQNHNPKLNTKKHSKK